ncbi:MAG: Branched-chain amino acid ABC transporter permease [Parcubacteria group bacterium GW2011_GWA2_49_9]|nr:MAG: Branched-chain amino acid ABC transporter permease [Parcubacteria group bacterium GW2011_GWA2_49_9]
MDIVPQLITNSLIAGSIYAILTLGFNLTYGTAKFIDMGYGVLAVIGGYSVFYFSKLLGLPLWLGALLGITISGLVSYLAYTFIYKPLRARKSSGAVLLIASLGVLTALQAVIAILFTSQFQTLSSLLSGNRIFELFGGTFTAVQLSIFGIGVVLFTVLAFLLKYTLFGKAVTAISDDEEVSKIVGINTDRIVGCIFFISGGGIGNIYGGIAGAFLLAFAENFGIWKIAGEWKGAITFGLLIMFLLWRPQGIFKR